MASACEAPHPKEGRNCSATARDCRDQTKTDLEAYTDLAGRSRFSARPAAGVGVSGVGAACEGGGGAADTTVVDAAGPEGGGEDMIVDDGDGSTDGGGAGSGGLDGYVDDGGIAGQTVRGASRLGTDEGLRQGGGSAGREADARDDDESSFDEASSDELVGVDGDDMGYESGGSWAGTREDFVQGEDDEESSVDGAGEAFGRQ